MFSIIPGTNRMFGSLINPNLKGQWRWFMNHRRIAAIALVLISAAAVYSNSHDHQANNSYTQPQSQFAQAGDIARRSPRHADPYAQAPEDSGAARAQTYSPVSFDAGTSRSDNYDPGDSAAGNLQPAAGSTAPNVASWTRRTGGDHSAVVALPPSWNLFEIAKGTVGVSGPNKEQVVLGFQTFVVPQSRNYAPYMGPEQALQWFLRSQAVQLLRIMDRVPAGHGNAGGQGEFMTVETQTQDGTRYKSLALVMTNRMQMNIWKFYLSYVSAPQQQFDAEAQTMMEIWKSWKLDSGYVQSGLDNAQRTEQQTATWMEEHIQHNQRVNANVNAGIDNALRGVSVMENTDTGVRGEVQIGTEQQVLRDCQLRGISCREVPTKELVAPQ